MLSQAQLKQFKEDGYVVIQGFAPTLVDPLRRATERTIAKGRSGEWKDVRKCGDDMWGVSNLLNPALKEPVFAEYMASPHVIEVSQQLLERNDLRLSLTNLLCNPLKTPYAIAWHRDAGNPRDSGEAELRELRKIQSSVQWNGALYEETCLRIVPGTHRRNITDAERDVLLNRNMDAMPGELHVRLRAGETVYYNAMLLHRGVYPTETRRETMHANLVAMQSDDTYRMHYEAVKFMAEPSFRANLPAPLLPFLDNWLKFSEQFRAAGVA